MKVTNSMVLPFRKPKNRNHSTAMVAIWIRTWVPEGSSGSPDARWVRIKMTSRVYQDKMIAQALALVKGQHSTKYNTKKHMQDEDD